jgi:hypothetical protein
MDKKTKCNYQIPSVKVVSFKVEGGFQPSLTQTNVYVGNVREQTSGIQAFEDEGSYSTVFGGRYN